METRKDEIRYVTSEPKKMLGKYLCKPAYQTYTDDFADEDTGEVVSVERHQLLFEKGTLIDKETLAQIMFYIQSGDLKNVEVSNQKRMASEDLCLHAKPFLATAFIHFKGVKFLLYATDIVNAVEILRDYIELNYYDNFSFQQIKDFGNCIILTDTYKREVEKNEEAEEFGRDEEGKVPVKKFYQLEVKIKYEDEMELLQTFVVNTYDVQRAMLLIQIFLTGLEEERKKKAREKGGDYEVRHADIAIESVKPISVSCFVPREFSNAYIKEDE